jgi:hypothetical protein
VSHGAPIWWLSPLGCLLGSAALFLSLIALLTFVRTSSPNDLESKPDERRIRMLGHLKQIFLAAGETTWAVGTAVLAGAREG